MSKVLLISEKTFREQSNISDNISNKFLLPAIREVQDIYLQEILGSPLYNKVIELVENNEIGLSGNTAYKELLDKAQWYLLYKVSAQIIPIASVKIDNAGAYQSATNDERYILNIDDTMQMADFYTHKADFYKLMLQNYLVEHYTDYPELTEVNYYELRSNIYSASSTGVWLGGARGKSRRGIYKPTYGYDKD